VFVMQRRDFCTVIVGSSALFREGLTRILDKAGFRIVASRSRVADLRCPSRSPPKPVLLIIDAGNDPDCATNEIALFKGSEPAARVAIIVDHVKLDAAISAFRAGANAYFLKDSTAETFIKVLDLVLRGETILLTGLLPSSAVENEDVHSPPGISDNEHAAKSVLVLQTDAWTPELSAREKCILHCLILGDSNKAIARKIDVAEGTVKVHIKAILRKIRAQNRTQAAIWAINNASWLEHGAIGAAGESTEPSEARIPALLDGRKLRDISGESD